MGHYQEYYYIRIMRVLRGEERKKGKKEYLETHSKSFPNLMKYMNLHIQEAKQTPRKINSKRITF